MPLARWKKISEETLNSNPWTDFRHDRFEIEGGRQGDYYYVAADDCSMVVPVTAEGKIILVNQYRYLWDRESLEFPCGSSRHHADPSGAGDADPEIAARRELSEEAGLTGVFRKVGEMDPCNGYSNERCHVFVARDLRPEKGEADWNEEFEVVTLSPGEFEAKVEAGEVWDGMTLAAWTLARKHLTPEI